MHPAIATCRIYIVLLPSFGFYEWVCTATYAQCVYTYTHMKLFINKSRVVIVKMEITIWFYLNNDDWFCSRELNWKFGRNILNDSL